MVTVQVKERKKVSMELSTEVIEVPVANALAQTVAENLRKRLQNVSCSEHPLQESILIVEADTIKAPIINKSRLCCQKLADQIQVRFT